MACSPNFPFFIVKLPMSKCVPNFVFKDKKKKEICGKWLLKTHLLVLSSQALAHKASRHVAFLHLLLFQWRTAIPDAPRTDANQSFYSERDNLWCAQRVTDPISSMFPLSCPMFRVVISLHQARRSSPATSISRVTIYPANNRSWQAACKQKEC